jgi:Zn finger protein HypA/HybF involved in hydrogenase expression
VRIAGIPSEATVKRVTVESPDVTVKREEVEVLPDEGIGACMVCNLSVRISDLPVWCPHCGNVAHREHLLEWIHVKDRCPKCGAHLNEQEICTEPPRRYGMPKRKKGVWKTV